MSVHEICQNILEFENVYSARAMHGERAPVRDDRALDFSEWTQLVPFGHILVERRASALLPVATWDTMRQQSPENTDSDGLLGS